MNKDYQIAIILKKEETEETCNFYPVSIVEGVFDKDNNCFIDINGNKFYHIIYNLGEYGFCNRVYLKDEMIKYPLLTSGLIKYIIYKNFVKYNFSLENDEENNVPVIKYGKSEECMSTFFDQDLLAYYTNFYRELYNTMMDDLKDNNSLQEEFDINKVFESINKIIVNQDVPLKQILSVISNHIKNEGTSSILVNGKKGVGKNTIIKGITENLNVPYATISLNSNHSIEFLSEKLSDALTKLLMDSNYDFEKAEHGILIINDFDKFTNNVSHNVSQDDKKQEMLASFLEEDHFTSIEGKEYRISASKLLIIGIGNWDIKKKLGFTMEDEKKVLTKKDLKEYGMNTRLLDKFDNIIELNDFVFEDYITLIKMDSSLLNIKKNQLLEKGIDLKYSNDIINSIASEAYKKGRGIKGLNEIIEETLLYANFEVSSNPDKYSELIITEDTLKDNKKYILKKACINK